jgi:AraC-like DNA-binding protein
MYLVIKSEEDMENPCIDYRISEKDKKSGIYPVSAGTQKCAPGYCWGPGVRMHFLIHYVISGKGRFYCGSSIYELSKGQAFVIFPNTVVKYCADEKEPWEYSWVVFTGDNSFEIMTKLGIFLQKPVFTPENPKALQRVMERMPRERSLEIRENLLFTSVLFELFALIAEEGKGVNKLNRYFIAATGYIKAHFAEDLTVDKVAEAVGVSRTYLFSVFKTACQKSPKEYILELRMERAGMLLNSTDLNIGFISNSVGYADPLLFSKMFKKYYGLSPKAFREKGIGK